jgi:hypothetical protein
MMKRRTPRALRRSAAASIVSALIAAVTPPVAAQHGAHVHGHGRMGVAIEDGQLYVELELPAVNVVGFEHPPRSDAERTGTRAALERFASTERLLRPSAAAGCEVTEVEVELPGSALHDGQIRDRHDADKHEHEHENSSGDAHGELRARYRWRCATPASLTAIEVGVFAATEGIEKLAAEVLGAGVQAAQDLTPADTVLRLRR